MTHSPKFLLVFALLFATNCLADTPTPLNPDVVPLKMEKNDVADTLDMKMWKFQVTTKKPNTEVILRLAFVPANTNTNYQVAGTVYSYTQQSTTAEVFVAMFPQSDGLHYVLRGPEGKTNAVQAKEVFDGWRQLTEVKDGVPVATKLTNGYKLFEFRKYPENETNVQLTETLRGVLTIELRDK